jgi:hypothetical protein
MGGGLALLASFCNGLVDLVGLEDLFFSFRYKKDDKNRINIIIYIFVKGKYLKVVIIIMLDTFLLILKIN